MGKSSAPSPSTAGVAQAQASVQAAQLEYRLGKEQLDNEKAQYDALYPHLTGIMAADEAGQKQANDLASQQDALYTGTYLPEEQKYAAQVQDYGSAANQAANAQSAQGAVAEQFDHARTAAENQLESYGVDPTSTRFASLDLGSRTQGAAAQAGAGTKAIRDTVNTGLALEGQDIGIGRGVVGAVNTGIGAGASAGSAGAQTGTSGFTAAANAIGTPNQFFSSGAQNMGVYSQAVSSYNTAQEQAAQINAQESAGMGSALGGIAGAVIGKLAAGGPTEAIPVTPQGNQPQGDQPVNGGAIPTEASPSGGQAVDDVNAKLTAGEFVVPKDVVRWEGEKHFYGLIEKARTARKDAKQNSGVGPEYQQAIPAQPTFVSRS